LTKKCRESEIGLYTVGVSDSAGNLLSLPTARYLLAASQSPSKNWRAAAIGKIQRVNESVE